MIRRHVAIFLTAIVCLPLGSASQTYAGSDPVATGLVRSLGTELVAIISDQTMSARERESRFRAVYLTYFDHSAIAKWTLGPRWRQATPSEQRQFVRLLEDFVVTSLARRLSHYEADRLLITHSEDQGSASIVRSEIVLRDSRASTIPVTWRLSQGLKVYDVAVDKVSLAINLRREISAMLRQGGGTIPGLLAVLRKKAAHGAAVGGAQLLPTSY